MAALVVGAVLVWLPAIVLVAWEWNIGFLVGPEDVPLVRLEEALRKDGVGVRVRPFGLAVRVNPWLDALVVTRARSPGYELVARALPTRRGAVVSVAFLGAAFFGALGISTVVFAGVLSFSVRQFTRRRLVPLLPALVAPVRRPVVAGSLAEARRLARVAAMAPPYGTPTGQWLVGLLAFGMGINGVARLGPSYAVPAYASLYTGIVAWAAWRHRHWRLTRAAGDEWTRRFGSALAAELDETGGGATGAAPIEVLLAAQEQLPRWVALDLEARAVKDVPVEINVLFGAVLFSAMLALIISFALPGFSNPISAPALLADGIAVALGAVLARMLGRMNRAREAAVHRTAEAWSQHLTDLRTQMVRYLEEL